MKVPVSGPHPEAADSGSPDIDDGAGAVASGSSACQVARVELRRQLAEWASREPGARLGDDPEELHQLRVAVRRIEATLGLFKAQLPARMMRARKTAKSVLRTLGSVRDFDVQLAELKRYCAALPPTERLAAVPLRSRLEAQRARTHSRMIRVLDSEPTRHWLEALNQGVAALETADAPDAVMATAVMPERVHRRFRKLRKTVRKLPAKAPMEHYHTVRRRAKQLRYAIECGAGLFGKPAEEMLKALRRLQDRLGEHQDAHLAKNRLAALVADASGPLPPETVFLMGRLAEHHLKVTAQARKILDRSWRRVRGKRWRALRARMEELSAAAAAQQAILEVTSAGAEVATGETPPPAVSGIEPALSPEPRPLRH